MDTGNINCIRQAFGSFLYVTVHNNAIESETITVIALTRATTTTTTATTTAQHKKKYK